MSNNFASDYIDVATRIAEVRAKYPEGSFQPIDPARPFWFEKVGDQTFLVYVAAFFRHPGDERPGIGSAWEQVPGRTPYTRNSELQNAESSAWGRALVAAFVADTKKGIASAEEVRNRQAEREEQQIRRDLGHTPGSKGVQGKRAERGKPEGGDPFETFTSADWIAAVSNADTETTLNVLGKQLAAARVGGHIDDAEFDRLAAIGTDRRAELREAGAA